MFYFSQPRNQTKPPKKKKQKAERTRYNLKLFYIFIYKNEEKISIINNIFLFFYFDCFLLESNRSKIMSNSEAKNVSLDIGAMVEAKDFCQTWLNAQVVQIDSLNNRAKIHFLDYTDDRLDEWLVIH